MTLVAHRERFGVIAPAATYFAHYVNIGKKIHFDAPQPVSLARFAAATLHVKTEAAGAIAALARFGQHGEEVANRRENTCVSGGIRTRRPADGRLIDLNDLVDLVGTNDFPVRGGRFAGTIKLLRQRAIENVVHQRGFAGPG